MIGQEVRFEALGRVLVALQMGLLGLLAWWGAQAPFVPLATWGLGGGALLLGVWALGTNRPGNFNIRPTPHPEGRLIRHGPYRWIRHPMYVAVLLAGAACAAAATGVRGWVVLAFLAGVLVVKARLEERWLAARHPDYAAYRSGTAGFIPGWF